MSMVWAVQQWAYAALTAALAGAGEAGADVAVYDHIPTADTLGGDRFYVRIDMHGVDYQPLRSPRSVGGVCAFSVHVFDAPIEGAASRGRRETFRLMEMIQTALEGARPVAGGSPIAVASIAILDDEEAEMVHGEVSCRVTVPR